MQHKYLVSILTTALSFSIFIVINDYIFAALEMVSQNDCGAWGGCRERYLGAVRLELFATAIYFALSAVIHTLILRKYLTKGETVQIYCVYIFLGTGAVLLSKLGMYILGL